MQDMLLPPPPPKVRPGGGLYLLVHTHPATGHPTVRKRTGAPPLILFSTIAYAPDPMPHPGRLAQEEAKYTGFMLATERR